MVRLKKAQAVQVSWLFILVAGAVILLFFVGIVFRQQNLAATSQAQGIAVDIETIFSGAEVSTGTWNSLQIPKVELTIKCEEEDSWFGIDWDKTGVNRKLPRKVVFSPETINGPSIITWALSFNAPFKVQNFLYITSPEYGYIFVASPGNEFAQRLYREFPEGAKKQIVSDLDLAVPESNRVKIIFFNNPKMQLPEKFSDKIVSAVNIDEPLNQLTFFSEKDDNLILQGNSFYIEDTSIFGAIFTESSESYECAMKKAMIRLEYVSEIYAEREKMLADYFSENSDRDIRQCSAMYDRLQSAQNEISDMSNACVVDFAGCQSVTSRISIPMNSLKMRNENLKQIPCPLIY